jgi:hypothetical protein
MDGWMGTICIHEMDYAKEFYTPTPVIKGTVSCDRLNKFWQKFSELERG